MTTDPDGKPYAHNAEQAEAHKRDLNRVDLNRVDLLASAGLCLVILAFTVAFLLAFFAS